MDHLVFLSFRGEDTRMNFTSHLYNALIQEGIKTYKDDKSLEIGKSIAPELLNAIETSRFAIMILSSNLATSKWCLEEIAKVVACEKQGKLIIIPVFYHVSPSDVRHQRNCFEQGFANHEADPEVTPQKVATWRAALERVGKIKGSHITPHREESEVIREIITTILKNIPDAPPTDATTRLVGIESQVNEVKKILSMESNDVHFIGIWGMSGIGKTTLARVVYDGIRKGTQKDEFHRRCFIENIKDISKENDTELYKVQQKLLAMILEDKSICVGSVFEGRSLLETKLRGMKVFIVLDDVNHLDQLTYLAGGREWFGPGSRIIVTTTNIDLLNRHKIINEVYRCDGLKGDEAFRLFWQSAFKGDSTDGYEKLSADIVKLADGLPLALNVYGSILYGKNESYWKEMLKKLGDYPHEDVLKKLEIVYNKLDRDQRNTFIYIACFLKGRSEGLVKDILTDIGLYSECGVTDLLNRSLITINHDDSVWMHDLLQLMCWEILHKESERYNERFIAIKNRKDVEVILSLKPERMRTIEIINQEPNKVDQGDYYSDDPACFSKMERLKFLRISNIHFSQGLDYLSNDLRILEWDGCSLKSLPSTFAPKHIYELQMRSSQLETLWEKDLDTPNLRSINLSFSKDLMRIPHLTSTTNLVELNLEGCTNLTELHESILCQKRLRYMNLKGCTGLQNLGRSTMEMDALEALLLSGCSNLEHVPEFGQNMHCLDHLLVDGTSIKKLPDNLGKMCALKKLDASGTLIEELPSSINHLNRLRLLRAHRCRLSPPKAGSFLYSNLGPSSSGLRELDLSYCNLDVVPDGIGLLYGLMNLDLSGNDFVSLPASLGLLSNLRMLCLNNCKKLQSLPKLSLIVNEDTYHGLHILQNRYNYYISGEGVDVSKVHATSNDSSPTISCLNCPKLTENENGHFLAERILNSYLQLRTNYWKTPEAVFVIVGGGRDIPSGFKQLGSDDLILEGPWIGLAICAVVAVHHVDACMDAKYMLTAHIHVKEAPYSSEKWEVPVPVNFFVAGLENQLVLYWTKPDDLQRTMEYSREKKNVVSLSFKPTDDNIQVIKFGVRLIGNDDILQLKQHEYSTSLAVHNLLRPVCFHFLEPRLCLPGYIADLDITKFYSGQFEEQPIIKFILEYGEQKGSSLIKFIIEYREQKHSLEGIHKIIKSLLEINQEVISKGREEWRHKLLFPFVYDYYRISHAASELYNDFVRLLKDESDRWLSVKLALKQILIKSREDGYTCKEQLDDLEAAKSVRFSHNFVTSFARICKHAVTFIQYLNGAIEGMKKFKSTKVLAEVLCMIIAGVVSMVATYIDDNSELLYNMKDKMSNSVSSAMKEMSKKLQKWFPYDLKKSYDRELPIWDFYDNALLLQELKKKMTGSSVVSKEEAEMMIDELEKKIDNFSKTLEDMSSDAHNYSNVTREAGKTLNQFIADDMFWATKFCFRPHKDMLQMKRFEDPMREAVSKLFLATVFLPASLGPYIKGWKNNKIKSLLKSVLEHSEPDSFYGILQILRCVSIHVKPITSLTDYYDFEEAQKHMSLRPLRDHSDKYSRNGSLILSGLKKSFEGIYKSWTSVTLALEQMLQKCRAGDYTYGEMLQQLNDLEATGTVGFSHEFIRCFEYICDATVDLLRCMSLVIYSKENLTTVSLEYITLGIYGKKVSNLLKRLGKEYSRRITSILGIVATCMGDFKLLQDMENISWKFFQSIQCFQRKSGKWFDERGSVQKASCGEELRIWDCYGNDLLLQQLKKKMAGFSSLSEENEGEMMTVIHVLRRKLDQQGRANLFGYPNTPIF